MTKPNPQTRTSPVNRRWNPVQLRQRPLRPIQSCPIYCPWFPLRSRTSRQLRYELARGALLVSTSSAVDYWRSKSSTPLHKQILYVLNSKLCKRFTNYAIQTRFSASRNLFHTMTPEVARCSKRLLPLCCSKPPPAPIDWHWGIPCAR